MHVAPFFKNGKPLQLTGFLDHFSRLAQKNMDYLKKLAALNAPLIGIEPSITLTYRDEYQKIIGRKNMGFTIQLPQEFLQKHLDKLPKINSPETYYLLSHCTEKTTLVETDQQWQTIFSAMGLQLISVSVGCCGMAGAYGHEIENRDNSYQLFQMDWRSLINKYGTHVLATGYSCRTQAKRFGKITLLHPLEILLSKINKER